MPRQFNGLMLGSVELFCLTAELQGFTAAAASAGLTPAAVSRSIARLEARLGVQLFVRTTRQVRLTDAGRSYHAQCRQALGQLVEAERELTGEQQVATGTVRISLPTSYGHYRVLPLLPAFRQHYPGVELEVQISNHNIDFAADGFDLAVRGRTPPDSGLVARPLGSVELVVVAAPQYLRRRGTPRTPQALLEHECIQFFLPRTGLPVPWMFRDKNGNAFELTPPGAVRCTHDVLGLATLARHGAGLVQTFRGVIEDDLKQGRLKEVLKDFGGSTLPFSLLYPANRHMPQRVRVLIDFLVERLAPG
ncbi:MAG TPA: LysR family transcriptional regulator [Rhizobacter sp.]|jgi:DNA-binding transcriptional LysR family regulator|nr:LysR family transcriptional regulator [Rhizobacter sp.]